mmetsp:Transcript_24898/g.33154  ORF Transcript_24898/g.33154 Transcript_24898/m.33154 type:complete len:286 (+) Transcript_24898:375-1232(+)
MSLAARILISAPSVYSLSLQQNIAPKVHCLAKLWGVADYQLHYQQQQHNDVSTTNNDMTYMPPTTTTSTKRKSAKEKEENILSRRLYEYPPVLTLSLEGNVQPTIHFYNATGYVRLDCDGNLVLSSSLSSIKKEVGDNDNDSNNKRSGDVHDNDDTKTTTNTITTTIRARYLATSLFNRLLPRWHYLKEKGVQRLSTATLQQQQQQQVQKENNNNNKNVIQYQKMNKSELPPLHLLAGASDAEFCQQLRLNRDDYNSFKEEAVPRLKFGSQFETWLKTGRPIDDA